MIINSLKKMNHKWHRPDAGQNDNMAHERATEKPRPHFNFNFHFKFKKKIVILYLCE